MSTAGSMRKEISEKVYHAGKRSVALKYTFLAPLRSSIVKSAIYRVEIPSRGALFRYCEGKVEVKNELFRGKLERITTKEALP